MAVCGVHRLVSHLQHTTLRICKKGKRGIYLEGRKQAAAQEIYLSPKREKKEGF
jgi:hypothetical protein